jgi:hypothetical protein
LHILQICRFEVCGVESFTGSPSEEKDTDCVPGLTSVAKLERNVRRHVQLDSIWKRSFGCSHPMSDRVVTYEHFSVPVRLGTQLLVSNGADILPRDARGSGEFSRNNSLDEVTFGGPGESSPDR